MSLGPVRSSNIDPSWEDSIEASSQKSIYDRGNTDHYGRSWHAVSRKFWEAGQQVVAGV
jgi:hypothetical protein